MSESNNVFSQSSRMEWQNGSRNTTILHIIHYPSDNKKWIFSTYMTLASYLDLTMEYSMQTDYDSVPSKQNTGKKVLRNKKISKLPVLELKVQVIYWSSHGRWPAVWYRIGQTIHWPFVPLLCDLLLMGWADCSVWKWFSFALHKHRCLKSDNISPHVQRLQPISPASNYSKFQFL